MVAMCPKIRLFAEVTVSGNYNTTVRPDLAIDMPISKEEESLFPAD